MSQFYLYIKDSQVRLIPSEKMPIHFYSDAPKEQDSKMYQHALQVAKQESILCADQATAEAEIYFKYFTSGKEHDGLKEGEIYGPFEGEYKIDIIKNNCMPGEGPEFVEVAILSEPERKIIIPVGTIKEGDVLTFKGNFINPDHTIRMVKQEEEKYRDLLKVINEKHAQLEREDRARRVTNSSQLQVMAGPNFKKEEDQEEDQKILWKRALEHCGSKMDPVKWLSDNFTITRK